MFIKEITIDGFKSYRQRTTIALLDKRDNVVVGCNGSGKSNFFSAIEFVLSNEYNNLRTEQRRRIINQAKASEGSSAFVEIVFDNSNSQIPIDRAEIRIRRTISKTKDQYMLDGRVVARKEVVQFLETAGLSNSNPYNIVKQGKINQLATARPPQLLQVLFEIAGIRIYNELRDYSMNTLRQTETEMKAVRESRDRHAQLVETLLQERGELERYEKLDKKRRVLEFVILEKEQTEIDSKLKGLLHARDTHEQKQRALAKRKAEAIQRAADTRKQLKQTEKELARAVEQQGNLPKEHHRLVKTKTTLELRVEDLTKELIGEDQRQERLDAQLNELNRTVEEREAALEVSARRCAKLRKQEDALAGEQQKKEQQRGERLDKQRRGMQFGSRVERDRWLKEELASLGNRMERNAARMLELGNELEKRKEKLAKGHEFISVHGKMCQKMAKQIDAYKLELHGLQGNRNEALQHQEDLWERESTLQQELVKRQEDLQKLEQAKKKRTSIQLVTGCESVRNVVGTFRSLGVSRNVVDGYHGQLVENFQCEENIYQAVETAAGGKLFYHIVESDTVAKEIVRACNERHLPGVFQFMPLNRLQGKTYQYPSDQRVVSLLSLLKYDKRHAVAMQMVFGQILLCSDLDTVPESVLRCGLSCVTYDGDQILQGVLKGGYHAPKTSILELHRRCNDSREATSALQTELEAIHTDLKQTEGRIGSCEAQMCQLQEKLHNISLSIDAERHKKRSLPEQRRKLGDACETLERTIRASQNEQELMESRAKALSAEVGVELADQLTVDDQRAIEQLDAEIRQLRQQQRELFDAGLEANGAKTKLQNMLNSNLLPKRDELVRSIEGSNREDRSNEMEGFRKQIEAVARKITLLLQQARELEGTITTISEQRNTQRKELEQWLQKLRRVEEEMTLNSPAMSPALLQRQTLEGRRSVCLEKMNELGALPAIDRVYYTLPQYKLIRELEQTNKKLTLFPSVNKKALDEYNRQTVKLAETDRRIAELTAAKDVIRSTFQELKVRREECIQSTFDNVNKHFREIFCLFVRDGEGHLILQTKNKDDETAAQDGTIEGTTERYVGLGLNVTFQGKDFMTEMNQLSGGQKTVVAITMILAIQRYKPAPFYLFDEIDQALDENRRTALASIIHELSNSSQFIMTTFRKQLLQQARKFYGVRCRNKVSRIDEVTQAQALEFVID